MARKGNMYDKEIESSFLKEKMVLKIYEPETFDSLYETQVVIMQDGNDYYQMGRVATISDRMHDDYGLVNTVFGGIHYIDRQDRLKKYHPEGEQYEAYKQFLIEEVIPLMNDIIPINPLGTTYSLMGDSLAGTIAFMTAIEYQHIFKKIVLQSPLVDEHVLKAARAIGSNTLKIYHSIGLKETDVYTSHEGHIDFLQPNQTLAAILQDKVSSYHYEEIEEGNHTWKYWQEEMMTVFERMFS